MRRALPVIAGVLALATVVPGHAGPDDKTATIQVPTIFVGMAPEEPGTGSAGCINPTDPTCQKAVLGRHHRTLYVNDPSAAQSDTTGVFGFTLNITRRGVPFTLRSEPAGTADFDITFYTTLGSAPDGAGVDPAPVTFSHFGNQAETGTVPAGATRAIVTLFGAPNSSFRYSS